MRRILITGGTTFVSRYVATYFAGLGDAVYVLNRNNRPQVPGVHLIEADRQNLGDCLRAYTFDAVLDITAYTQQDVQALLAALPSQTMDYIFLSSSAIYPETLPQPFREDQPGGYNTFWQEYGLNKWAAEQYVTERLPQAYVLRPPYLYGPMENLYREPFVFDCAFAGRPFYLPEKGQLPLQFFHVADLCRFMQQLLTLHPAHRVYNVGNDATISAADWVGLCYQIVGTPCQLVSVSPDHEARQYFPFANYAYRLDVSRQKELLPQTIPLIQGLKEAYDWYAMHPEEVKKKPFFAYIDEHLAKRC